MRSNTQTAMALRQVESLDLRTPRRDLQERWGWSSRRLDAVEALYRRFLALLMVYRGRFVCPTDDIDAFWQAHIFDTAAYQRDCRALFGQCLDHHAYFGLDGRGHHAAHERAFGETRALFIEHFGIDPCAYEDRAGDASPRAFARVRGVNAVRSGVAAPRHPRRHLVHLRYSAR